MSMSASCQITNNTGSEIVITTMGKVNDDATWQAPAVGTVVANGQSFTIAMGNSSFFPKGVGFNMQFLDLDNKTMGGVYLDDPAVGAHHFNYGNQAVFKYTTTNPSGNSYAVDIQLN